MRLSQIVEANDLATRIRHRIQVLVSGPQPDWKLAGKLAVDLQHRGYKNAAKRVQMAATDENEKALGSILKDLLEDHGIFPEDS